MNRFDVFTLYTLASLAVHCGRRCIHHGRRVHATRRHVRPHHHRRHR